jgi:SAM-dependent methyltransferase
MLDLLRWAAVRTTRDGVFPTIKAAGAYGIDLLFDWKFGTDTMRWVGKDALGAVSENRRHSRCYKPSKSRPFLKLLRSLDLPRDCNFVDIGAGKGRVLLLASQCGFRKVIGIEFSSDLCAQARRNLEAYSRKVSLRSPIHIVEADATTHRFGPEDRVFYLFNPFDAVVLTQVLRNLGRSLAQHPRRVWLIYNDPQHHDVVVEAGFFRSESTREVDGTIFGIYSA